MAVKVAIANPKGGVGKSLTTMMLADGLALSLGARVLVLDMDPQAGSTKAMLGITAERELRAKGIGLDAIVRMWSRGTEVRLAPHCVQAGDVSELAMRHPGFIDMLPSNANLLGEIIEFEQAIHRLKRQQRIDAVMATFLKSALSKIERNYDVVLFDCPAGPVPLAMTAIRCAKHLVVPTQLEENAYSTFKDFLQWIIDDNLGLAETVTVHPLITQYHANNPMQRQMLDHINAGLYKLNAVSRPVPYTAALQKAARHPGPGAFRSAREKYGTALNDVVAVTKAVGQRIQLKKPRGR